MICSFWCWKLVCTDFSHLFKFEERFFVYVQTNLQTGSRVFIVLWYADSTLVCFRSEVAKLQLPSTTGAEQQLGAGTRPGQRCCLDSQHDRCSPTGRAVTTPDKSKSSPLKWSFSTHRLAPLMSLWWSNMTPTWSPGVELHPLHQWFLPPSR